MGDLVLKDFGEHKMYLIKKDVGISKTLRKEHGYANREIAFMTLIRETIKPGQVCFDVGANIGYVTMIMAKLVGPTGTVYAVEPTKNNFKVLKKNIKVNNYNNIIKADRMAISNRSGVGKLFLSDQSNLSSLSRHDKIIPHKSEKVQTMTIDEYLQGKKLPDVYKMDVEGHEVKILNGMHATAKRSKSGTKIFVEIHPKLYGKELNMEEALRDFVKLGFFFRYVVSAAISQPKLFKKKGYSPDRVFDVSGWKRGIYEGIDTEDAINFASHVHKEYIPHRKRTTHKIVRYIVLEKI